MTLCRIEFPDRIHLGIIGDVCVGLGGACAIAFVFSGTLKFEPKDSGSIVRLISVSFIAGAFGADIVQLAGRRLIKLAEETATKAAKAEVDPARASYYAQAATRMMDEGIRATIGAEKYYSWALQLAEVSLSLDPKDRRAYLEKARALRRLNRLESALDTLNQALEVQPDEVARNLVDIGEAKCRYNRACYLSLLQRGEGQILSDLGRAFDVLPSQRMVAKEDSDLAWARQFKDIQNLLE